MLRHVYMVKLSKEPLIYGILAESAPLTNVGNLILNNNNYNYNNVEKIKKKREKTQLDFIIQIEMFVAPSPVAIDHGLNLLILLFRILLMCAAGFAWLVLTKIEDCLDC